MLICLYKKLIIIKMLVSFASKAISTFQLFPLSKERSIELDDIFFGRSFTIRIDLIDQIIHSLTLTCPSIIPSAFTSLLFIIELRVRFILSCVQHTITIGVCFTEYFLSSCHFLFSVGQVALHLLTHFIRCSILFLSRIRLPHTIGGCNFGMNTSDQCFVESLRGCYLCHRVQFLIIIIITLTNFWLVIVPFIALQLFFLYTWLHTFLKHFNL